MLRVSNIGVIDPAGGRRVDSVVDVPEGFGEWVFMLFTTGFRILTPSGLVDEGPGGIVINSPSFPQWHRGAGGPFHNYWVHFGGARVAALLERYGVEPDVVLRLASPFRCLPTLVSMQREFNFREPFWEEALEDLMHALLREVARQLELGGRAELGEHDRFRLDAFTDLRVLVWNRVDHAWTVAELAREMGLSESRTSHLYRRYFGVSPIDDLIAARLERAKALLVAEPVPVSHVAERCGFSSVYYFSRLFRRRVGMTPTEYRSGARRGDRDSRIVQVADGSSIARRAGRVQDRPG